MHSTVDQSPFEEQRLPFIVNQLAGATSIFVHTGNDVRRLAEIGLTRDVVCVPQGVLNLDIDTPTRRDATPFTLATYGFFLPGKGLGELARALKILSARDVRVRLLMINAHYQDRTGLSENEIRSVSREIEQLGISDLVEMSTDYLDEHESVAKLRQAQLIVLPYQRTGESSSAAVRTCLSAGVPIAVTPSRIFDDVSDLVYKLPGYTPDDIASGIEQFIDNTRKSIGFFTETLSRANNWCRRNDVRQTSEYINRAILLYETRSDWQTVFESPSTMIVIKDAYVRDGEIVCDAVHGAIVHGPYINILAGVYLFEAAIRTENRSGTCGRLVLSTNAGAEVIVDIAIPARGEISYVSKTFFLKESRTLFECVFFGTGYRYTISRYILRRKNYKDRDNWSEDRNINIQRRLIPSTLQLFHVDRIMRSVKNQDDSYEFVTAVYRTMLGRDPDDDGLQRWTGTLTEGLLTRQELIEKFITSDEFHDRYRQ